MGNSGWYRQEAGIRQGCPLSSYPFILVTTVIYADIKRRVGTNHYVNRPTAMREDTVLYEDDTVVISGKKPQA